MDIQNNDLQEKGKASLKKKGETGQE